MHQPMTFTMTASRPVGVRASNVIRLRDGLRPASRATCFMAMTTRSGDQPAAFADVVATKHPAGADECRELAVGPGEAFERFRCFSNLQFRFERLSRFDPGAAGQCCVAGDATGGTGQGHGARQL